MIESPQTSYTSTLRSRACVSPTCRMPRWPHAYNCHHLTFASISKQQPLIVVVVSSQWELTTTTISTTHIHNYFDDQWELLIDRRNSYGHGRFEWLWRDSVGGWVASIIKFYGTQHTCTHRSLSTVNKITLFFMFMLFNSKLDSFIYIWRIVTADVILRLIRSFWPLCVAF